MLPKEWLQAFNQTSANTKYSLHSVYTCGKKKINGFLSISPRKHCGRFAILKMSDTKVRNIWTKCWNYTVTANVISLRRKLKGREWKEWALLKTATKIWLIKVHQWNSPFVAREEGWMNNVVLVNGQQYRRVRTGQLPGVTVWPWKQVCLILQSVSLKRETLVKVIYFEL